ncbi:MAG: DUF3306 domain-containing protein [Ramlibacter sp.]|nr:DUF3306 domain-containing protein [Ramlibacter sp.]
MSDGFLGRWSKRKLDVKQGKAVEAEPVEALLPVPPPQPSPGGGGSSALLPPPPGEGGGGGNASPERPTLPTLEEARALTPQSDFRRFAAADVAPEVKNAALKKLFTDPRYNVMDGMDVYIGDYSKPDPMPYSMLRQLASAKFLGLFDQEEKEEAAAEAAALEAGREARDVADNPNAQTVAQSEAAPPAVPEPPQHADPDLRLQQDHASPGKDPGHGTG